MFKELTVGLPEDGTHVPKHNGEGSFRFLLIKNLHMVGKSVVFTDIKNCTEWTTLEQTEK